MTARTRHGDTTCYSSATAASEKSSAKASTFLKALIATDSRYLGRAAAAAKRKIRKQLRRDTQLS
jgi:hypothetical protein